MASLRQNQPEIAGQHTMTTALAPWIVMHVAGLLFWCWLLCRGGAERIEGWAAWGLLGWFAGHWNAEQIRLYALLLLILELLWFIGGLFSPDLRF